MVTVTIGGWESAVTGEVDGSPRFNVFLIGFSRYVVLVPRRVPLLLLRCARGVHCHTRQVSPIIT
jgi:hypothetical protein